MTRTLAPLLVTGLLLAGCGETPPPATVDGRWYDTARVERGARVYAEHCAACHGAGAEGAADWRRRDAAGNLPPPPLDGSGHAWHHPFAVLASQIKFGAPGGQGTMPALGPVLDDEAIIDVVAWLQSHWSDDIYAAWTEREQQFQEGTPR